jgi:pimeloyl-ACP methyl ester carboxylesterase
MKTKIVLLHGLFGSPENWAQLIDEMGAEYEFIVPELPMATRHYQTIERLTDFLDEYLYVDKMILCGNSLGGQIAIDFTLRYPKRVKKLVLTGSAGLGENNLADGKRPNLSRQMVLDKTNRVFYNSSHVTDELIDETYALLNDRRSLLSILRLAKSVRDSNMRYELHRLDLPTLLVWGENDNVTPKNTAEEFHRGIKNSTLEYISECGHAPQIERPEEFAKLMTTFIDGDYYE